MINHGILMYPMDKTIFCLLDACALWFRMFFLPHKTMHTLGWRILQWKRAIGLGWKLLMLEPHSKTSNLPRNWLWNPAWSVYIYIVFQQTLWFCHDCAGWEGAWGLSPKSFSRCIYIIYVYIYIIVSTILEIEWLLTWSLRVCGFPRLAFFEMVKMTDTAEPLIHLSNFCQWSFWICSQGLALRHSSLKKQSPMPDNIKNIPLRTENEHCNSYFLHRICSLPAIAAGWCALNTSRHGKWRCSFIRRGNRPLVVSHRYAKWMNVLVRCFTVPNNCVFFK